MKESVVVHGVTSGEHRGSIHTHGLTALGHPEIEMRAVPLFLFDDASRFLLALVQYVKSGGDLQTERRVHVGNRLPVTFSLGPSDLDELCGSSSQVLLASDATGEGACDNCAEPHDGMIWSLKIPDA